MALTIEQQSLMSDRDYHHLANGCNGCGSKKNGKYNPEKAEKHVVRNLSDRARINKSREGTGVSKTTPTPKKANKSRTEQLTAGIAGARNVSDSGSKTFEDSLQSQPEVTTRAPIVAKAASTSYDDLPFTERLKNLASSGLPAVATKWSEALRGMHDQIEKHLNNMGETSQTGAAHTHLYKAYMHLEQHDLAHGEENHDEAYSHLKKAADYIAKAGRIARDSKGAASRFLISPNDATSKSMTFSEATNFALRDYLVHQAKSGITTKVVPVSIPELSDETKGVADKIKEEQEKGKNTAVAASTMPIAKVSKAKAKDYSEDEPEDEEDISDEDLVKTGPSHLDLAKKRRSPEAQKSLLTEAVEGRRRRVADANAALEKDRQEAATRDNTDWDAKRAAKLKKAKEYTEKARPHITAVAQAMAQKTEIPKEAANFFGKNLDKVISMVKDSRVRRAQSKRAAKLKAEMETARANRDEGSE
jgi:hypothetical protein